MLKNEILLGRVKKTDPFSIEKLKSHKMKNFG